MLFYEINVGDNTYKLKLNTRNIVNLEKALGCNPLMIFGNADRVPTVSEMVEIFHNALQAYHHEISKAQTYQLFDEWLEEGHAITDFIPIILEIYKVSGIINKDALETEKN